MIHPTQAGRRRMLCVLAVASVIAAAGGLGSGWLGTGGLGTGGLGTGLDRLAAAEQAGTPTEKGAGRPTVSLTIDYGDGFQKRFVQIPWQKEMTVSTVMRWAARHPRGKVQFRQRGKGATALLLAIDELENEGGSGKNWIFRVNQELAKQSFAVTPLEPGDAVLWKFDTYR